MAPDGDAMGSALAMWHWIAAEAADRCAVGPQAGPACKTADAERAKTVSLKEQRFPASDETRMVAFRDYLSAHGLTCTIRKSRGEDILAACGMLVNALSHNA